MKNQRGFVWLPLLLVVLGILIVSGGAYVYIQTRHTPASIDLSNSVLIATSTSQHQFQTTIPSATIDQVSLTSSSGNPTITGEAYGAAKVYIALAHNGDAVGSVDATVDASGHWSAYFSSGTLYGSSTLAPTWYSVNISDANGKSLMNGTTLVITSVVQTYTNSQYGFSLQYPSGVAINTSSVSGQSYGANMTAGNQVAVIGPITKGFTAVESGWGDHGFVSTTGKMTLGISSNTTDVTNCAVAPSSAEDGPYGVQNQSVNGTNFLSYSMGGPAAGLFGKDQFYKTLHNGTCYSIDAQITGGESGHMNTVDATANDAVIAQVQNELNSIVQSFHFTN